MRSNFKKVIFCIFAISIQVFLMSFPSIVKGEDWKSKGGTWKYSANQVFGQGSSDFNKTFSMKQDFTDFVFEVRIRKVSQNDGPIGLLMRYDEQRDEGYMFLLWPHGDYQISRLVNQTRHRLGSGTPKALNKGNLWNSVKVIGIGTQLKVYINGDLQANFEDDAYSFGRLGLVIHGGPDQRAEFEILSMNSF